MKFFYSFVLTILSVAILLAMLTTLGDYTLILTNLTKFRLRGFFETYCQYLVFSFIGLVFYWFFLPLLLVELAVRKFSLRLFPFILMTELVALLAVWWSGGDAFNVLAGGDEIKAKNIICLILLGFLYPFISKFWARKFNLHT